MTEDTVRNYFLVAGKSFRTSEYWNDEFTNDGKARILHSGQFGIGVFAAFLLGPKISVQSRHASSPEYGVEFSAALNDEQIQLIRKRDLPVGTKISIKVFKRAAEILLKNPALWDWFTLKFPSVERIGVLVGTARIDNPSENEMPLPDGWARIDNIHFSDIQWSWSGSKQLFVNGFAVIEFQNSLHQWFEEPAIKWQYEGTKFFRAPALSVFDRDAKLPLTLQRDALATRVLPFSKQLLSSITKEFCAFMLALSPNDPLAAVEINLNRRVAAMLSRIIISDNVSWERLFGETSSGTTLIHPVTLGLSGITEIHQILWKNRRPLDRKFLPKTKAVCSFIYSDSETERPEMKEENLLDKLLRGQYDDILGAPTEAAAALDKSISGHLTYYEDFDFHDTRKWWVYSRDKDDEAQSVLEELLELLPEQNAVAGVSVLKYEAFKPEQSPFARTLRRILPDPIIPYDLDERRRKFRYAYRELAESIARWEAWNRSNK